MVVGKGVLSKRMIWSNPPCLDAFILTPRSPDNKGRIMIMPVIEPLPEGRASEGCERTPEIAYVNMYLSLTFEGDILLLWANWKIYS
jgi:hypothetical protein